MATVRQSFPTRNPVTQRGSGRIIQSVNGSVSNPMINFGGIGGIGLIGGIGGMGGIGQGLGGGLSPEQVAQLVNQINQDAQKQANAGRIPGAADLESTSSANIANALAGQVDPSVLRMLGQQSAERGIRTGSPGGPSTNADYLRSLGLTTMDLMGQGQNWLTQALGRNPAAPIYDAGNLVITPERQAQLNLQQQQLMEQIRSNQSNEAIARMRGTGASLGGGMGGGGGWDPLGLANQFSADNAAKQRAQDEQRAAYTNTFPDLFPAQQTVNTTTGPGTFTSMGGGSQGTNWDDFFSNDLWAPGWSTGGGTGWDSTWNNSGGGGGSMYNAPSVSTNGSFGDDFDWWNF